MIDPRLVLVYVGIAVAVLVGEETIKGVKWLGREAKKGGAAVVLVLKKIPHPHHTGEKQ